MTKSNHSDLKKVWEQRQKRRGNTLNAVLLKNFPYFLNFMIHKKHSCFVLGNIENNDLDILDVGCGYGRLAREIIKLKPNVSIEGIEICQSFSQEFSKNIGPCYNGPVQHYNAEKKYDIIILSTVLMYIPEHELERVIDNIWSHVKVGGRVVCIENTSNILIELRKWMGSRFFVPTGCDVTYFSGERLDSLFLFKRGAEKISHNLIGLFFDSIPFYYCASYKKTL